MMMKKNDIENFQSVIEDVRNEFLNKSYEFMGDPIETRKQQAYARNRDIILEKLQESLMWLENMKIFDPF